MTIWCGKCGVKFTTPAAFSHESHGCAAINNDEDKKKEVIK